MNPLSVVLASALDAAEASMEVNMKRAVTYGRVSGDDRSKDGRNLKGQMDLCRAYAEQRGYRILHELAEDDRGASGASFELPELSKALELARAKEMDVFVVREIDRLSRNLAKQLAVEAEFKRNNVSVEYVLGDYPDTAEGRLNKNIRASIAEFEREQISIRMSRGRKLKIKAGSVMTHGRAPYGYQLRSDEKRFWLEADKDQARIVQLIFTWYAVDRLSILKIIQRLKTMGVRTKADDERGYRKIRGACEWSRATVHHILSNEVYIGVWRYSKRNRSEKEKPSVAVPAIIEHSLFNLAQQIRAKNKANMLLEPKNPYLLRGFIKCGHCGSRVSAYPNHTRGKTYLYYHCQAHKNFARECSMRGRTFSATKLDAMVWQWIKGALASDERIEEGFARYEFEYTKSHTAIESRLEALDSVLIDERARMKKLLDLYMAEEFDKDILVERKTRLEENIRALEVERANVASQLNASKLTSEQKDDIRAFAQKIRGQLDIADGNLNAQRRLLETLRLSVIIQIEDGKKLAKAECLLGGMQLQLTPNSSEIRGSRAAG